MCTQVRPTTENHSTNAARTGTRTKLITKRQKRHHHGIDRNDRQTKHGSQTTPRVLCENTARELLMIEMSLTIWIETIRLKNLGF